MEDKHFDVMLKKYLFLVSLALLFAVSSCNKTDLEAGGGLPISKLLLSDATFDSSGHPVLGGWKYGRSDVDSNAHFVKDVPPGSYASWSLALSPGWIPSTEFVHREFSNLSTGIYELSVWAKVTQANGRGNIIMARSALQPWIAFASVEVRDTNWHKYILLDTLTSKITDTLSVILTGGSTEVANWEVLYNTITLLIK